MEPNMAIIPRTSEIKRQTLQFLEEDFVHPIFFLATNIAHQAFLFIHQNSGRLQSEEQESIIRKNFLSAKTISGNIEYGRLIQRVNVIVHKQLALMLSPVIVDSIAKFDCLSIPTKELKNIHIFSTSNLLTQSQPVENKSEEEKRIDVFVENFNNNFSERDSYIEKAIRIISDIEKRSWLLDEKESKITPNEREVNVARSSLLSLYSCDDPMIKEKALWHLIEIVECDPLTMDSAFGLVDLQEILTDMIQTRETQKLNVELQRLLVKAYAITLACILIHASKKHLNALTEDIKDKILKSARDIADSNIVKDPEINFWAEYALQGALCIKTGESKVAEWLVRIADVITLAICIYQGDGILESMDRLFDDMSVTFRHIGNEKEWFASLIVLKKFCHYWMNDAGKFSKIVDLIKQQTCGKTKKEYLYGLVSTLEYVCLKSTIKEVKEDSLKLLLQYYLIAKPPVNERVIIALENLSEHGELKLKNTARMLIKLLDAVKNISEKKECRESDSSLLETHFFQNESYNSKSEQEIFPIKRSFKSNKPGSRVSFMFRSGSSVRSFNLINKDDVYQNVIEFLIRRLAGIKEKKNYTYGGDSLVTLLSHSTKDHVIPSLLKCLAQFSSEFWEPNARGETPFHIAVKEQNLRMIKHIKNAFDIEINACEYECSNTALHYAVELKLYSIVSLLLSIGADSNIRNRFGQTALHLAVIGKKRVITKLLLNNGAKLDIMDEKGDTSLDTAIKLDIVPQVKTILKHSGDDVITSPIIASARNRSETTLISLLRKIDEELTPLESLEILRMISKRGKKPSCCAEFCEFHLEFMDTNKYYANSFRYFNDWPILIKDSGGRFKLIQTIRRKETLPYNDSCEVDAGIVDGLGNTLAIKYARNIKWLKDFRALINSSSEMVSKSNILGITPLHAASIAGNKEGVGFLLNNGAIVDTADSMGYTPLHFAAFLNDHDVINILLENGANPNQENTKGETPFLMFCGSDHKRVPETLLAIIDKPKYKKTDSKEHLATLKQMIEKKADPFHKDKKNNNALHLAAAWGHRRAIRYLCRKYPSLFWQKNNFSTLPINTAIMYKRGNYLKDFFQKKIVSDPISFNDRFIKETKGISTAGDILVRAGHLEMLDKLFDLFEDAPYKQNCTPFGFTPLHTAASIGNERAIDAYTRKKLSLDALDSFGNRAVHIAILNKKIVFLKQLVFAGANLKLKNEYGSTPLHLAASLQGDDADEIFSIIFDKNPETAFAKDNRGDYPLHIACNCGNLYAVKLICEKYPELTKAICDDVNTPLHLAAANGFDKIAAYLIKFEVDLDARNAFRLTPLHLAAQQGHDNVLQVLLALNAEIRATDYEDETALHKAAFNRHIGAITLLLNKGKFRVRLEKTSLVDLTDSNGNTPLFKFAQGHSDKSNVDVALDQSILQLFIDSGVNLNLQNNLGDTFLHEVCYRGLDHILDYLSKGKKSKSLNVEFSVVNYRKESLLHKAIAGKKLMTVQKLTKFGNIDSENEDNVTPLLFSAKLGYAHIAEFLLWEKKVSITHTDKEGRNILHYILSNTSISKEMRKLLKRILKTDPDLILRQDKKKRTPFHVLAENGHIDVLDLILSYLPGDSEKYFILENKAKQTAFDIAKEKHKDLARKIVNFPKDKVGYEYRDMTDKKKKKNRAKKVKKAEKNIW